MKPITHSSTAKQEKKQKERGSCQTLGEMKNILKQECDLWNQLIGLLIYLYILFLVSL